MHLRRVPAAIAVMVALVSGIGSAAADGSFDSTFDQDGVVAHDFGGTEWVDVVRPVYDGSTLVAGLAAPGQYVARLAPDGSLDRTYADGGVAWLDDSFLRVLELDVDIDDNVFVLADRRVGRSRSMVVAKVLPSGERDPSFGVDGVVTLGDLAAESASLRLMLFTGRLLVVTGPRVLDVDTTTGEIDVRAVESGEVVASHLNENGGYLAIRSPDGSGALLLARLNADGTVDPDYGRPTAVPAPDGAPFNRVELVEEFRGRVLFMLNQSSPFDVRTVVRRTHFDGRPDRSFGTSGQTVLDGHHAQMIFEVGKALDVDQFGRAIVGATLASYRSSSLAMAVFRLTPDGLVDAGFGDRGVAVIDVGGYERAHDLAWSRGGITVAGSLSPDISLNGADLLTARLADRIPTELEGRMELVPPMMAARLLTVDGEPVAGEWVAFDAGGEQQCMTRTDTDGVARCPSVEGLGAAVSHGRFSVWFPGSLTYDGSADSASVLEAARPTG